MNEDSAKRTTPNLTNFRYGTLHNYQRCFSLVSVSGIKSGVACWDTMEVAALAIRPCDGSFVKGCLYEIPSNELDAYIEREHRYKLIQTLIIEDNCRECLAYVVMEQSNDEYVASMSSDEYQSRIGQYYGGILWGRKDILPMRGYLLRCLQAVLSIAVDIDIDSSAGAACNTTASASVDNFLDDTYLADDKTSLRVYIKTRAKAQAQANVEESESEWFPKDVMDVVNAK